MKVEKNRVENVVPVIDRAAAFAEKWCRKIRHWTKMLEARKKSMSGRQ